LVAGILPKRLDGPTKRREFDGCPSTAAVSSLRYLEGQEVVSFHTVTLPEDSCVPLLVKYLGSGWLAGWKSGIEIVREYVTCLVLVKGVR